MLAKNAVQKLDTEKPSTSDETSMRTSALITSKKIPKVTTVKGSVRIIRIGFTTALANPRSRAAIASAPAVSNLIPLKI